MTLSGVSQGHRNARRHVCLVFVAVATFMAGCNVAPPAAPARIAVGAQPNGIAVRPGDGALFITDDRSNAVLWSTDRATWAPYASLPAVAGQANSLSQLVFAQDASQTGTLLVERFGFGEAGALFAVSPAGETHALSGLAPERRRLGLASIGTGRALSSWFVKQGNQPITGGVSLVTYDATTHAAAERDLIVGLVKPLGLAVRGDTLFVTDQSKGAILRYGLSALLASSTPAQGGTVDAQIESPDLLAVDRTGALYTKCGTHGFCRIGPNGAVTSLADDFRDARGVAVDDARHVVYVVDRAKASDGASSEIRVFPVTNDDTSASHQDGD